MPSRKPQSALRGKVRFGEAPKNQDAGCVRFPSRVETVARTLRSPKISRGKQVQALRFSSYGSRDCGILAVRDIPTPEPRHEFHPPRAKATARQANPHELAQTNCLQR